MSDFYCSVLAETFLYRHALITFFQVGSKIIFNTKLMNVTFGVYLLFRTESTL